MSNSYEEMYKQIFCYGYHISAEWTSLEDSPEMCTIPYEYKYLLIDKGWQQTNHPRFSRDGEAVWLCPECWEKWQQERKSRIEHLIKTKNRLSAEYRVASCEYQVYIIDKLLPNLIKEFESYNPTSIERDLIYNE